MHSSFCSPLIPPRHHTSDLSTISPMPPPLPKRADQNTPPPTTARPSEEAARDVMIKDIVVKGVSGILYKWVNYGRGWRPRWFVLHDGVLSYYKIHGRHRIALSQESGNGSKVIGEESIRQVARHRNGASQVPRQPVGEVHLKVSSICESRCDDRRFSIFTGTKRLHLRTETREDRAAWMEALQAVKDLFPRVSNSELMAPLNNVAVSTDRLREWLLQDSVGEAAIQDSEEITRSEFATLQDELVVLKQKQWHLMDTLRLLEWQASKDWLCIIFYKLVTNYKAPTLFGKRFFSLYKLRTAFISLSRKS